MNKQILVDNAAAAVGILRLDDGTYVVIARNNVSRAERRATFSAAEQRPAWACARLWAARAEAAGGTTAEPCGFWVGSEYYPEENQHEPVECGAVTTKATPDGDRLCAVHYAFWAKTGQFAV